MEQVVIPGKGGHKLGEGLGENLIGAAHLVNAALIHHHNLIGEGVGLILVMDHLDKGHAKLPLQFPQFGASPNP
jgi:hypothetical protein